MSIFSKDVQLYTDLKELIAYTERQANPPKVVGKVIGAISPGLEALMPMTQKQARRHLGILLRVKARLEELTDEVYK